MEYTKLLAHIKQRRFAPVYLFYGEEKYLIDQVVHQILNHLIDSNLKDFNLDILYGSDTNGGKIIDIATSYPMMAPHRVVVVKEAHKLSPRDLKLLTKYAERPMSSTCLLLIIPAVSAKSKSFLQLKEKVQWVEFKPLYDNQIPAWIKTYLQEKGVDISPKAIQLLQSYVGNSLQALTNELEKVLLNIGERRKIEAEDVQAVVGLTKEFNVFELSHAIGSKNLEKSLMTVTRMLDLGETPTGIIVMLTRYFSSLLKVKYWLRSGKSQKEIALLVGVPLYFLKDYINEEKNFSSENLVSAFKHLLEADINLKFSYQKPKMVMQLLIYKLIRG